MAEAPALQLQRPADDEHLPVVVRVLAGDGNWTPGPHCSIECGNELELTVAELAWIVEDAGPAALEALRAETAS